MASQAVEYPDAVELFSVGTSYENRETRGFKINVGKGTGKKAIFFESNIHANEHITSATATWIINELLTSVDPSVIELAERYEW